MTKFSIKKPQQSNRKVILIIELKLKKLFRNLGFREF